MCQIDYYASVEGWFGYGSNVVRRPTFNPISGDYSVLLYDGYLGQFFKVPSNSQKCIISLKTSIASDNLQIFISIGGGIGVLYSGPVTTSSFTIDFDPTDIPADAQLALVFGGGVNSYIDDVSLICQCPIQYSCLSDNFLVIPGNFTKEQAKQACVGYNTSLAAVSSHNINQIEPAFSNCGISNQKGWINSWDSAVLDQFFVKNVTIAPALSKNNTFNAVCNRPTDALELNVPTCSNGNYIIRVGIFTNAEAKTACGASGLADVNNGNKQFLMNLISSCNLNIPVWVKSWDGNSFGNGCNVFYKTGAWNNLGSSDCANRYAALCNV
eukprot:TRINITY_DN403_c0_g1_i3.p1 TRINITY_DN403_c0_g1~~TRINITY_DN403_c0_g1_i3.p1  ORF type:complete len:326 (+),score=48.55 TRINITY_DN403_c0_g1_i3:144-1121(+)